jgi:hypothetical protein
LDQLALQVLQDLLAQTERRAQLVLLAQQDHKVLQDLLAHRELAGQKVTRAIQAHRVFR